MLKRRLGFGGSWALGVTSGVVLAAACNVYDSSLLTGGSSGQGGTSSGGDGTGGESGAELGGTGSGTGGVEGGGTGGTGGTSGEGGTSGQGGADPTGGTGTGGSKGGSAGTTGGSGRGGSKGGDAGDSSTGGKAGSGGDAGSGGGNGGNGGSGGGGGNAGSAGTCGKCGCGKAETPDTDDDGVLDCNDACMGFNDADCSALKNALVHRYSFDGMGMTATDSKGTANGTIFNATLAGTGSLTLTGGNTTMPPYVNLPNGIISSLTNATFEVWVTWNQSGTSNQDWQRIFDFGTPGTEDFMPNANPATYGTTYLCLTSRAGASPNVLRGIFSVNGASGEIPVNAGMALPTGMQQHVALVIDDQNDQMTIYLNGTPQSALLNFTGQLSQITDVNNWLGRSQYSGNYEFIGVYNEFRIYNAALSAAQIRTSSMAGPDATFF